MSARFELLLEGTRTEYYDKGRSAGIKEGALTTLFGLVGDGLLTSKTAAERSSMSEALFKEKMAEHQRA